MTHDGDEPGGVLLGVRSLLFAPGSDARKLGRAFASGADAVIADLEDAVAPDEKVRARDTVASALADAAPGGPVRVVRINHPDTGLAEGDVAMALDAGADALLVPKATPDTIAALGAAGPPVIALIETALGLRLAYETARQPRVAALMLGGADLALDLDLRPRADHLEVLYARGAIVVDSGAAGLRPPFDVVHLDVRDLEGLEEQARLARSLGFGGKACIHPAQLDAVHRAFTPSEEDVREAREVVAAHERGVAEGRGAVAIAGKMIDGPIVQRAYRTLAQAQRGARARS
jgi:citrate lyase beta subunit